MERIPASERTREKLKAVIEGTEKGAGASELVRLAARLIIEEALEGEARDVLGREYYARGAALDRRWHPLICRASPALGRLAGTSIRQLVAFAH
jgi:hypothetical protein